MNVLLAMEVVSSIAITQMAATGVHAGRDLLRVKMAGLVKVSNSPYQQMIFMCVCVCLTLPNRLLDWIGQGSVWKQVQKRCEKLSLLYPHTKHTCPKKQAKTAGPVVDI